MIYPSPFVVSLSNHLKAPLQNLRTRGLALSLQPNSNMNLVHPVTSQ